MTALGVAIVATMGSSQHDEDTAAATAVEQRSLIAVEMPQCEAAEASDPVASIGDPRMRKSAQRGLDYLASAASEWQERHNCYGCHVQAVTVEALAVGFHNQYTVADADINNVLRGMLDVKGGARQAGGLNHSSPTIGQTGKLLGGAAFARYDQWVNGRLSDFMLTEAQAMLSMQASDGHVPMPWVSKPVATGHIQGTAHAVVTWKQAYERTADDQWLTAVSRAEDWLRGTSSKWTDAPPSNLQDLNYAIMGLLAAGVSNSETVMARSAKQLSNWQNTDGGFSLTRGEPSSAFGTGQALYTLRLMGHSDTDPIVARGTNWLIEHQRTDGSWSSAGFGKAEAMWAVLGLVSVDVLSVTVTGVVDGQHLSSPLPLTAQAKDNKGTGVSHIAVYVDDIRVHAVCGDELQYELNPAGWTQGKHIVEVRATNARGQVSRRFVDVYTGDVYLTRIGTRYAGSSTEISLRNIAEDNPSSRVRVEIYAASGDDGQVVPGAKLHSMTREGRQGPMSFQWSGEGREAGSDGDDKYVARLSLVDASGNAVHTEDVVFVHDTLQAQRDNWAQLEGRLALPDGADAQNAEVELIDADGNIVQRTKSTKKGKYRFRNIKSKTGYKVRVKKQGFEGVSPAPAAKGVDNNVDLELIAK